MSKSLAMIVGVAVLLIVHPPLWLSIPLWLLLMSIALRGYVLAQRELNLARRARLRAQDEARETTARRNGGAKRCS